MADNFLHSNITSEIIKCFYKVYNELGYGFLEKVYHNSLIIELQKVGLTCGSKIPIEVHYENKLVGLYVADIVVNDEVIIETKVADNLCPDHEMQLVNYLKATDIQVGMLLNFGPKPQFKRKVFTAEFKKHKMNDKS